MRKRKFNSEKAAFAAVSLLMLFPVFAVRAAITGPYTVDAETVHLFHLDENAEATSTANAVPDTFNAIPVTVTTNAQAGVAVSNSVLGAMGYTGFGAAANVATTTQGVGYDQNNDGIFSQETTTASTDRILASSLRAADGSFTVEALINLPQGEALNRAATRYIVGIENQGSTSTRAWNFVIDNLGQLNFFWVTNTVQGLIPTTGPDAFANDTWFHAAFVYDGTAGASQLYWTKLDGSNTEAHALGSLNTTTTFPALTSTAGGTLVIGNTDRNSAAFTGGFGGLIDEVRISNTARGANEFIFNATTLLTGDVNGDQIVNQLDLNVVFGNWLSTGATLAQGDANSDGVINQLDINTITGNWLATGPASGFASSTVPEPTGLALAGISLAGFMARMRRPRRASAVFRRETR